MWAALLLVLRFGVVILIYLFLFHVLRLMYRDLGREVSRAGRREGLPPKPQSKLLVGGRMVLWVREASNRSLKKGDFYPLGESILIGREESNDIVLKDTRVSGHHAAITRQGQRWQIRDLGSTNGTFVNGKRIEGQVDLSPGDEVRIGGVIFEVGWENAGRGAHSYRAGSYRQ